MAKSKWLIFSRDFANKERELAIRGRERVTDAELLMEGMEMMVDDYAFGLGSIS